VSEACDLRWDDLDLPKRTITVRRLKGSTDSVHYLERDELAGLKRLQREPRSAYVFVNERGQPFGRMGIGRMIERAGETAKLPFPVHVHMLRHSTGFALAGKGGRVLTQARQKASRCSAKRRCSCYGGRYPQRSLTRT
jgi:integrase